MAHDILQFRINEMAPFLSHGDAADQRLNEAHALSQLLADINIDGDTFIGMNPDLRHAVIEGIVHLIAYAQFHLQCADEDRQQRAQPAAAAA